MGFFRKKKPDVIDFTSGSKRNIPEVRNSPADSEVVDFSSSSSSSSSTSSSDVDFLGHLAGADTSSSGSVTDSLRTARQRNQMDKELSEMKLKLDDNDYKLNNIVQKVKELEMRLREKGI